VAPGAYQFQHYRTTQLPGIMYSYLVLLFFAAAFLAAEAGLTLLAGLDFPKDPLKIFPFFVFLSPLPM
jgi:hypothetical protein